MHILRHHKESRNGHATCLGHSDGGAIVLCEDGSLFDQIAFAIGAGSEKEEENQQATYK